MSVALDIRTLVLVLGCTRVIQLAVVAHQYLLNRHVRGVVGWLLWSVAEVLAFACLLLCELPDAPRFLIFVQSLLLVLGLAFCYVGVVRFLGRIERRTVVIGLSALFAAAFLFFLYGDDDTFARGVVVHTALAVASFSSAYALLQYGRRAVAASARFLSAAFILHGGFCAFRAAALAAGAGVFRSFADPSLVSAAALVEAIIAGLFWTFGCIMIINQRAQAEAITARNEVASSLRRKQDEAARAEVEIQNQQLQKVESLSRMAGAIAHHFNNRLHVVMGNLELAMDTLSPVAAAAQHLASAMEAARAAADVSGLMLDYVGRDSGRHVRLDLAELCRKSLPLLRATAAAPREVLLTADATQPGPMICGNAKQIQQVLANLVANGWEACAPGQGTVRVTVSTVFPADIARSCCFPVGWQPADRAYACIAVMDSGCGIPAQDVAKIFDPFFSTKFVGRGLGLAVGLGLVRAHGGGIAVASDPGRGSTFRIYLPVDTQPAPRPSGSADPAAKPVAGGIVLVVEDEEPLRELAVTMVASLGFAVLQARDGVEAQAVLRQHGAAIRCVVCDVGMPRMNGWETLDALRGIQADLPVVLVSGYDEASVMAGAHASRPQAFLGKPYTLNKLRQAIDLALGAA